MWRGTFHGGDRSLAHSGPLRPAPGWAQHRMPIPGLYQTGGTTHPGGSVTGGPGRNAAVVMLTDLGQDLDEVVEQVAGATRVVARMTGGRARNRGNCARAHTVTIRDVARVAKVHPGTVSRALNEETRALVNPGDGGARSRAARQLGYRPNRIARGLKTSRSHTIGVLIPDITNPLFPPILRGIEDRLDEVGYTSLIVNTDNDPERERGLSRCDPRPSGRRFHLRHGAARSRAARRARRRRHPASARQPQPRRRLRARGNRQRPAGNRARSRARGALGHERIGHVAGPQNLSTGHRRHLGFVEAMRAAGLEAPSEHICFGASFTEEAGARACAELLDAAPELTAIVAANDLLAIGCYDELGSQGIAAPTTSRSSASTTCRSSTACAHR